MMNRILIKIIRKTIDLHVHVGPEIIPRKFDAVGLARAEIGNLAGAVMKNHFYPTTPWADQQKSKSFQMFGSIVLNNFVGGINPDAVYSASLVTNKPFVVWFPTVSAKQFLDNSVYEIAPEWVKQKNFNARMSASIKGINILNKKGQLESAVIKILKVIKDTNAILATGHISWKESLALVRAAYSIGIKKIIITHPVYQKISMPLDVQKKIIKWGAKIEHCFSMYSIDRIPIVFIAQQIKQVGAQNCILSSDVGQKFSVSPSQALFIFAKKLVEQGIKYSELEIMLEKNTRQIVGLSTK